MSNALGKRKRAAPAKGKEETTEPDNTADIQALLRQHFEARFGSLSGIAPQKPEDEDEDEDDDSEDYDSDSDNNSGSDSDEWGGISEDDDDGNTPTLPAPPQPQLTPPTSQNPPKSK